MHRTEIEARTNEVLFRTEKEEEKEKEKEKRKVKDPIHGWIQLNFDVCDVTGFRNAQPGCSLMC